MLKINDINIKGIGGVKNLNIEFNDGINIICGPNGIGKSTILECIHALFMTTIGDLKHLKRNALVSEGSITTNISLGGESKEGTIFLKEIKPYNKNENKVHWAEYCRDIMFFKTNRNIEYISVDSIKKDPNNNNYQISTVQSDYGVMSNDIKQWFISRHLWSAHEHGLNDIQRENLELAKSCFSILDSDIKFNTVDPTSHDIMLSTPEGEIYFEYLSSGYKAVLHLLLGFIKEMEYRNQSDSKIVKNYDGVILIDEVDLHLHPQWQSKIMNSIREIFPNAQIIVTTHSPHIIQSARANEVIALTKKSNGDTVIKELPNTQYGFQGWTVEEILEDVMELETVQSELYNNVIKKFENAIDNNCYNEAKKNYEILSKMLHPQNHTLKLLKIQMVGMRDND